MNVKEEHECQYWRCLLTELQRVMTMAEIAAEVGVGERIVWHWKNGNRPTGLKAIRVYLLHVKRCNSLHVPDQTLST